MSRHLYLKNASKRNAIVARTLDVQVKCSRTTIVSDGRMFSRKCRSKHFQQTTLFAVLLYCMSFKQNQTSIYKWNEGRYPQEIDSHLQRFLNRCNNSSAGAVLPQSDVWILNLRNAKFQFHKPYGLNFPITVQYYYVHVIHKWSIFSTGFTDILLQYHYSHFIFFYLYKSLFNWKTYQLRSHESPKWKILLHDF